MASVLFPKIAEVLGRQRQEEKVCREKKGRTAKEAKTARDQRVKALWEVWDGLGLTQILSALKELLFAKEELVGPNMTGTEIRAFIGTHVEGGFQRRVAISLERRQINYTIHLTIILPGADWESDFEFTLDNSAKPEETKGEVADWIDDRISAALAR